MRDTVSRETVYLGCGAIDGCGLASNCMFTLMLMLTLTFTLMLTLMFTLMLPPMFTLVFTLMFGSAKTGKMNPRSP